MTSFNHDGSEDAFTLVELLAALVITAVIAGFVVSGLRLTLRGWSISNSRQTFETTNSAVDQMRAMLMRALPIAGIDRNNGLARLYFEGHDQSLAFVTLSEAAAFRGGPMRVRISWLDQPPVSGRPAILALRAGVFRANQDQVLEYAAVPMFRNVTGFSVAYFGATRAGEKPAWRSDWLGQTKLPSLVRLTIDVLENGQPRHLILPVAPRVTSTE